MGVAVLLKKEIPFTSTRTWEDLNGCYAGVTVRWRRQTVTLFIVYAPNYCRIGCYGK